jgi:penicillin-binding protein 2
MRSRRPENHSIDEAQVSLARLRVFGLILLAMISGLAARLWVLQVLRGGNFHLQAASNRVRTVRAAAPRGAIEDATGKVLVTNEAQFTVFLQPTDLPKDEAEQDVFLGRFADVLGTNREHLKAVIKKNNPGGNNPIPITEGASPKVLARIAENQRDLPGISAEVEPVRKYPYGAFAAHLLGYIGQLSEEQMAHPQTREDIVKRGYKPGDFIGQDGVEKQYDFLLNGVAGGDKYEIDARGRRQRAIGREEPIPGATLRLGLNMEVQRAAEKALGNRKGAAVAIDPRDGRVIALASFPDFDPNKLARRPLATEIYQKEILPGLFHEAIQAQMPPGSTFKIVTSAAGLGDNKISPTDGFYCGGGLSFGRYFKRCHSSHGGVSLTRALEASCDVFYYQVGKRMKAETLAQWGRKFGIGEKSGIDLPHEFAGIMPSPEWKARMAPKWNGDPEWRPGDTANVVIGQGDVLTTPLQMALVVGAIGNGGTVWEPRVVTEAYTGLDKKIVYRMKPVVRHRLGLPEKDIAAIAKGLRAVVVGGSGTSRSANLKGVAVAGKSGSAELRGGRGGGRGATHAWFVCYAPFDKPTIAICVFLESEGQNYHGGADAAPVARTMLAAHFKVPDVVGQRGGGSNAD